MSNEILETMKTSGVEHVEILITEKGKDCPACAKVAEKVWAIDKAPELPLEGCTCGPLFKPVYTIRGMGGL